jgi:hypothetical protein
VFAGSTSANTGVTDGQGTNARFSNPKGMAIAADGSILVADCNNYRIRRVTTSGTRLWQFRDPIVDN